ncbi:DNA repair and recombination protein RadB [Oxyplasma meridianum]|uniref:DNA repair and recombination protein RadB n=1 Tax=Oxyplasma meridianum TaxID=3073602 RepID=A0AAX4NES4_9ARCH
MEKIDPSTSIERLQSGVECIDSVMGGGLEPGVITEFYGEGGSGKSNLAVVFSVAAIKLGKTAIYLDTEGFSGDRFMQICGSDRSIAENMQLFRVSSLDDQELSIMRVTKNLEKMKNPGILVVDSFTEFFRLEKSNDYNSRVNGIQRQLSMLSGIALKFSIPVLLTNQIYMDVDSKNLQPFGGFIIDHVMKSIIRLEKDGEGVRKIRVIKHRSVPEGKESRFRIVEYGVTCEG